MPAGRQPVSHPRSTATRQRLLDALKRVLRESQYSRAVVFEDLHWIDTETQALLDRLVDSLPTARILLLSTTARISAWLSNKTSYTHCGSITATGER